MTDRLIQMRTEQIALLTQALAKATERVQHYRATYPAINENDGGWYLDGSSREDLEDFGGSVRPSYRMWSLGYVSRRELLLYEDIDWTRWDLMSNSADIGIDTYGLALSDPDHSTYHNQGGWIGKVKIDELLNDTDYTIDTIVWMTDALDRFLSTDAAFREAVEEFTTEYAHMAKSKLVLH